MLLFAHGIVGRADLPIPETLFAAAAAAVLVVSFVALALGWSPRSVAFVRKHIRLVNLIGGSLLIVLGLLMVVGVWGTWMSTLQGVMLNVQLPL